MKYNFIPDKLPASVNKSQTSESCLASSLQYFIYVSGYFTILVVSPVELCSSTNKALY